MSKAKYPRAAAIEVARQIVEHLKGYCEPERLIVAGSLRRKKSEVGDVEVVYVPKWMTLPDGLFDTVSVPQDRLATNVMLGERIISQRTNVNGSTMWGDKNKFAVHCTGIPVDFFATTEAAFFNYLVCRTGPAEFNTRIASRAQERGWKWNPYGEGFTDLRTGEIIPVKSERDVFTLLELDYLEPWERA